MMAANPTKPRCLHCISLYVTFPESTYGQVGDESVKMYRAKVTKWRCMACGKTFTTEEK